MFGYNKVKKAKGLIFSIVQLYFFLDLSMIGYTVVYSEMFMENL